MNSRDKALRFKRLMPCEFDDEDVEDLIKFLDQHAAEARAEQREACADRFDFEEDQLLCLNATGESDDK